MKHKNHNGFTMIELMVTVTVIAILATVGVPALGEFIKSSRVTGAVNDFIVATTLARSEAIKRRAFVTVCVSANSLDAGPDCDTTEWENGWVVFADTDGDAVIDAGEEVLQAHGPLDDLMAVRTDAALADYVSFSRSGLTRTTAGASLTGNLVFCDDRGITEAAGGNSTARALRLARTGRAESVSTQSVIAGLSIGCP